MRTIHAWTAGRSGDVITIEGRRHDGAPIKLTGVSVIRAATPWPIAVDEQGLEWELAGEDAAGRAANVAHDAGVMLVA